MDRLKIVLPTALASVAAIPPKLDSEFVAREVETQFDLRGNYRSLISERDQNFRLTTANGRRYVVKITGLTETQAVSDFQIDALLHLEAAGLQAVPRVVRTRSGQARGRISTADNGESCLRVVTYLDGDVLSDGEITRDLAQKFGRRVAELDLALQDFSHEGQHQVLLWDTQRAAEILGLSPLISDTAIRELVEVVLTDFKDRVLPGLKNLPRQVIHNDVNTDNVLVDANGEISGIIDFGDMLYAPRIVELSTAMSYLRPSGTDPMLLIAAFVSGYQSANPVSTAELDLLFDLIRTRLSMTLTLSNWRRDARGPGDPYQQKTVGGDPGAITFLAALGDLGRSTFRTCIGDI